MAGGVEGVTGRESHMKSQLLSPSRLGSVQMMV